MSRRAAWLVALVTPAMALAGGFDDVITGITLGEAAGTLGVSLFSGVVVLLLRLHASQTARLRQNEGKPYDDDAIIRGSLLLYGVAHLSGSVLAGYLTFFLTHDAIASGHAVAAAILSAAVGGAKAVEKLAEKNQRYVETMRMR